MVRLVEPDCADQITNRLLTDFGTVGRLLSASPQTLARHTGNSLLSLILPAARALVLEALHEDVQRVSFDPSDKRILSYVTGLFQGATNERLHVVYLDAHYRYIRQEQLAEGDWSRVELNLSVLCESARDFSAANLVLMHNHPSGVCAPSHDDIALTREISAIVRQNGLSIFEHLIVCGPNVFSMRKAGVL